MNEKEPLFSIIIPVYNAEKTIDRCVESIIQSGKDDVEIVLVEDCGKDDSLKKCRLLAEKYPQVKVIHNEVNRGVSFTRNRAIENATGKYLLFVDSDDYVAEDYVPTFKKAVERDCDLAVCGYYQYGKDFDKTIVWEGIKEKEYLLRDCLEKLYDQVLLQQLWNKVFQTNKVKEKGIRFDESINLGEDTRFILEYIQKNKIEKVAILDKPLYHYIRDNKDSLTNKVGYESVEEWLYNKKMLYEILEVPNDEIEERIAKEREGQINLQAYFIMHNAGMKMGEKKRLILNLGKGKKLFWSQYKIYVKEKIAKFFKRK